MSMSVRLIFQFYTELELLKVAAGTIDPTPTLLGLTVFNVFKVKIPTKHNLGDVEHSAQN